MKIKIWNVSVDDNNFLWSYKISDTNFHNLSDMFCADYSYLFS